MASSTPSKEGHRNAQRTLRIAITCVKKSLSAFQSASESGHLILVDLSDTLLLLVPSMNLGVLSSVSEYGPLRDLCGQKLLLRLQSLSRKLSLVCAELSEAEKDVSMSYDSILDIVKQDELTISDDAPIAGWKASLPVFSSISVAEASSLLKEVSVEIKKEVSLRLSICQLLDPSGNLIQPIVASFNASSGKTASSGSLPRHNMSIKVEDRLRQRLTVYQAIWFSNLFLGNVRLLAILEALTEDMVGH